MTFGLRIVAGWIGFVALFGLALLAWAAYSGQLDGDANYVPFREREPEAWPDRHLIAKGGRS